jgi:pimeloyl-ACP methyl ester carboxylesterase
MTRSPKGPRLTRRGLLAAAGGSAALPPWAYATAATPADVRDASRPSPAATAGEPAGIARHREYWPCRYGQVNVRSWTPTAARATRPPLLCLHQNPRSSRDFARLAPLLATDRRVYALDTPGCGDSDPPPAPASIAELALVLDEAIAGSGLPGRGAPLDLFGQHTGATLALELAASRPRRVRRLALLGIPFVALPEREAWRQRFAQPRPWVEDAAYLDAQWKRSLEAARGLDLPEEELLARFADALRGAPRAAWAFDAVFRYPFEERLPRVRQPTLALVVEETIAPNSRAAAALLPDARVVELADLDGRALDTAPRRLADQLRTFLDA